jgi:hypothetical protein
MREVEEAIVGAELRWTGRREFSMEFEEGKEAEKGKKRGGGD